jgi:micrococcal nuclease
VKQFHWVLVVFAIITLMGFRHWAEDRNSHTVAKVFDGDTIKLDDNRTIRMVGVDAPEVDSPYTREEPGGRGSREYLKKLIEGKKIVVRAGPEPLDRYGRTLGFVYLGNVLVNGRIIRDGWARAYLRFDYPHKDLFVAYEQEARAPKAREKGGIEGRPAGLSPDAGRFPCSRALSSDSGRSASTR